MTFDNETYRLDARSERNFGGVHPDLVRVLRFAHFKLAQSNPRLSFIGTCGLRTAAQQRELLASGASTTMDSRHLSGHAYDIAATINGRLSWDWPLYYQLASVIKQAAAELNVPVEWGGDWKKFKDGPHWQLPKAQYPR